MCVVKVSLPDKNYTKLLLKVQRYSPSHLRPCMKKPAMREPQWSQKVGDMKVYGLKRCGMSILKRSRSSYNIGKEQFCELRRKMCEYNMSVSLTIVLAELKTEPEHLLRSFSWHFLCTAVWHAADVTNDIRRVHGFEIWFAYLYIDSPSFRIPTRIDYKMRRTSAVERISPQIYGHCNREF